MKVYTLTQTAYGQPAGMTVALDENDPMVKLNVENGVLVEDAKEAPEPAKMTCPICKENMKRPTKLDSPEELASHYADKHAGFVVPDYQPDTESEE